MNIWEKDILTLCDFYRIFENGKARVILIKNDKQKKHKYVFGFWNFSNEETENQAVFDIMEQECCKLGVTDLIGPLNYSTWFDYRLALDNYDINLYPDCEGSAEQTQFLISRGYKTSLVYSSKIFEYAEADDFIKRTPPLSKKSEMVLEEGHAIENLTKDIYEISIDCFADAELYTPLSFEAYTDIYLLPFRRQGVNPYAVLIRCNDEPVAFSFSYTCDFNDYYTCKTIGIKKRFQKDRAILMNLIKGVLISYSENKDKKIVFHFQKADSFRHFYKDNAVKKTYGLFFKRI